MARAIEEAIYIRANNSTLNRNVGKYNLPWDKVLFSISELKNKINDLSTTTSVLYEVSQQINGPQHYNICVS